MKCVGALPPPSGAVLPGTALFYPQQSRKAWAKIWLTAWLTDFTSGAGTPSQDEQDGPELGPTRKDTLCARHILLTPDLRATAFLGCSHIASISSQSPGCARGSEASPT